MEKRDKFKNNNEKGNSTSSSSWQSLVLLSSYCSHNLIHAQLKSYHFCDLKLPLIYDAFLHGFEFLFSQKFQLMRISTSHSR